MSDELVRSPRLEPGICHGPDEEGHSHADLSQRPRLCRDQIHDPDCEALGVGLAGPLVRVLRAGNFLHHAHHQRPVGPEKTPPILVAAVFQ